MEAPCPICRRPARVTKDNPWRPFCSERCRLLDLSRWFDGDYAIPAEPAEPPDDEGER